MLKKIFYSATGVLVLALIYVVVNIMSTAGVFTDVQATRDHSCERVDIFSGTEDVTVDPATGLVFVSADDRRAGVAGGGQRVSGGIYAFHIEHPEEVTKVSVDAPEDFHPHGISLWTGKDEFGTDEKRLMVINHAQTGAQIVEIFAVADGGLLTHLESVSFEQMHSPNDLVAVGPRSFYATNDRRYRDGLMALLESYLSLPFSSAVFYNGQTGSTVADGLKYANGINISKNGNNLYIAEVLRRSIGVYDRKISTGALTHIKSIELDTGPDNIEIALDGTLWVASHPKLFEFLAHAADANVDAPTQIQSINIETDQVTDRIVLLDGEINAASVGAPYQDKVVIGAVFDGHVLVCET
ncbi:MAG: SMP-30/gluconolactonase/LRE family protein [Pseudomonadota bacterium]